MKKLAFASLIIFFSFNVFAASSYTSCTNGDIAEVGDRLFVADFFDDSTNFQIYEGFLSFGVEDMIWKGNTMAIMDLEVPYYVEGVEVSRTVNAMVVIAEDWKSAKVTYSIDKSNFVSLDLSCEEVPYNHPKK